MATTYQEQTEQTWTRPALIDCDLHNDLNSIKDLFPYLSAAWREHIQTYGLHRPGGGNYPRFQSRRGDSLPPNGRAPGSDLPFMRLNFLDPQRVAYGILTPLASAYAQLNFDLGAALATAYNDWLVAEWLEPEPRLRSSIVTSFEDPPAAVAEIRRRASDRRFVQVQFTGRPQEPMGRRKYWPIYEACEEYGLVVMSHAFGSYGQPITGTGWGSFYIEDHVGPAQAMQANILSMVAEGVFDRFPGLKLLSAENGFAWLPSLMWRMDNSYTLFKTEVPHLKRMPSEYVRDHVYVCTQPMEEPNKPRYFREMLEQFGDVGDNIVFASDYPHWDSDEPDECFPVPLSPELEQKIYFDNGAKLYGLK